MPRGGTRPGAGRPLGSGRFGEPTVPVRVPKSLLSEFREWIRNSVLSMRHYDCRVAAGRPVVAGEGRAQRVEVNGLLGTRNATDFAVTVSGNDMADDGIADRDRLIVDAEAAPEAGRLVVAEIGGRIVVRSLCRNGQARALRSSRPGVPDIDADGKGVKLLGVVRTVIRPF